jgi:hypothetical protein
MNLGGDLFMSCTFLFTEVSMSNTCMSAQGAGVTRLGSFYVHVLQREQEGTLCSLVAVSSSGAVSSTGEGSQGSLVALWVADTHHVRETAHRRHRSHAPALRSHTRR